MRPRNEGKPSSAVVRGESVVEKRQADRKLSYDFPSRVAVSRRKKKLAAEGRGLFSGFTENTQKMRNPILMRGGGKAAG